MTCRSVSRLTRAYQYKNHPPAKPSITTTFPLYNTIRSFPSNGGDLTASLFIQRTTDTPHHPSHPNNNLLRTHGVIINSRQHSTTRLPLLSIRCCLLMLPTILMEWSVLADTHLFMAFISCIIEGCIELHWIGFYPRTRNRRDLVVKINAA